MRYDLAVFFLVIFFVLEADSTSNKEYNWLRFNYLETEKSSTKAVNRKKAELGKMLFFDKNLSADSTVSCETCHQPNLYFTDGVSLSTLGVSGKKLKRHTPSVINMAFHNGFFWDGGAKNLESLILGPLTDEDEMGMNLKVLEANLNEDLNYQKKFNLAFGIDTIRIAHLQKALAAYMGTLQMSGTKFDQFLIGESELTSTEIKGFNLFVDKKCISCHQLPMMSDFSYHNTGLDSVYSEAFERLAMGRFRITRDSSLIGAFKTPSLKFVSNTAPYMHDGRFENLMGVLNHYSGDLYDNPYLDRKLDPQGINMSTEEKKAIIEFLQIL
ncbi:cytochrome-c peroxidase [Aureibacter tunicatorum]|uniref:Cytochrome c peroxidase n=1 Tax=Aureibacter tunicatorum TaxID=866807 RepID=A0AAE3XKE8_9BACT|nr:cytochrome c peroxidase [Aureibacter tunicatorum]MDR6239436.1 cytochrome c peroxidase [Aureibacter tunicatorum]BDD04641.1 cytochrome-c peroxidase [Aureibacter tunicatorum]